MIIGVAIPFNLMNLIASQVAGIIGILSISNIIFANYYIKSS